MTKNRIRGLLWLAAALLVLAPCLMLTAFAEVDPVEINEENFPDNCFREYVGTHLDKNKDGILSESELMGVQSINISCMPVKDLKGIEFFQDLNGLSCTGTEISKLDLTQNGDLVKLYCSGLGLTELNLENNWKLNVLFCNQNDLTELDLSRNNNLRILHLGQNQLTELDVKGCEDLEELDCSFNSLTKLTLGSKPKLTWLDCNMNELTSLDLSEAPVLDYLRCSKNSLTELDISKNTALTDLVCSSNSLKKLDVTKLPLLETLQILDTDIPTLDLSRNTDLKELTAGDSLLRLDVTNNAKLNLLRCDSKYLLLLDLKDCPALAWVYANGEKVETPSNWVWSGTYDGNSTRLILAPGFTPWVSDTVPIDEEQFPDESFRQYVLETFDSDGDEQLSAGELKNAKTMDCSGKGIRDLKGLEFFTSLQGLNCSGNELESLDVSNNAALTELDCSGNQLKWMDVWGAESLGKLACQHNKLEYLLLDNSRILTEVMLNSDRELSGGVESYSYKGHALSLDEFVPLLLFGQPNDSVAIDSRHFPDPIFKNFVRRFDINKDGFLTTYERGMAGEINCAGMGIQSLNGINYFTHLGSLNCSGNELTRLDINIAPLKTLNCSGNRLTDLYLDCFALQELDCSGNDLTELNLDKAPHIKDTVQNGTRSESDGVHTYTHYSGYELIVDAATELEVDGVPITEKYFPDDAFRTFILENIDKNENKRLDPEEADRGYNTLDVSGQGIASLEGLSYFQFERLDCSDNKLTELDLSIFPELDKAYCSNNQLKTLTLGSNGELADLWCDHNELAELDLSGCPILKDAVRYQTFTDHHNDDEHGPYSHYGTTKGDITVDDKTKLRLNEHDVVPVEAVEPTYADSGNLAHYRCTDCGKIFNDPYGENEIDKNSVYLPRLGVDVTGAHKNKTEKVLEVTLDRERYDEIRLILAQYDKDGRFVSASFMTVTNSLNEQIMPLPTAAHFRVMVTDKDQRPMGSSYYE